MDFESRIEEDILGIRAWGKDDSLQDIINYGKGVLEKAISSGCSGVIYDKR